MAGTSQAIDLDEEPSLEHLPGDWEQLSEASRHGWILSWHEQNRGKRLCPLGYQRTTVRPANAWEAVAVGGQRAQLNRHRR